MVRTDEGGTDNAALPCFRDPISDQATKDRLNGRCFWRRCVPASIRKFNPSPAVRPDDAVNHESQPVLQTDQRPKLRSEALQSREAFQAEKKRPIHQKAVTL